MLLEKTNSEERQIFNTKIQKLQIIVDEKEKGLNDFFQREADYLKQISELKSINKILEDKKDSITLKLEKKTKDYEILL